MSEELEGQEGVTPAEPAASQTQPEPSSVEVQALEQGWRPKEEWAGDPDDWVPAKEFVRVGKLFERIDDQNRRLRSVEDTNKKLAQHLEMVRKTEYQKALNALRAERKEALANGDADGVDSAEEKMGRLATQYQVEQAQKQEQQIQNEPNPVLVKWTEKNRWYNENRAMRLAADDYGAHLVALGERNPEAVLEKIEKYVRQEFPEKFKNPKRDAPGSVEGGGTKSSQSTTTKVTLTDVEKRVMEKFVKAGVMTREEYIADIAEQRKLEGA